MRRVACSGRLPRSSMPIERLACLMASGSVTDTSMARAGQCAPPLCEAVGGRLAGQAALAADTQLLVLTHGGGSRSSSMQRTYEAHPA